MVEDVDVFQFFGSGAQTAHLPGQAVAFRAIETQVPHGGADNVLRLVKVGSELFRTPCDSFGVSGVDLLCRSTQKDCPARVPHEVSEAYIARQPYIRACIPMHTTEL